jgi:hypothetical protein
VSELEEVRARFKQAWDDIIRLTEGPGTVFTAEPVRFLEPTAYGIWFPERAGNSGGWITDSQGHIYWLPSHGAGLAQLSALSFDVRQRAEVRAIGPDGWPTDPAPIPYGGNPEEGCL